MHPKDMPQDARDATELLGGHECACCPIEVRSLHAIAYNLTKGSGVTRERMDDLRQAVERLQPLMDAHFAATGQQVQVRVTRLEAKDPDRFIAGVSAALKGSTNG